MKVYLIVIWGGCMDDCRCTRASLNFLKIRWRKIFNLIFLQFEGQWYEVEKTFYMMEMTASCTSFNFTLNPDGTSYKVQIGTKNRL